MLFPGLYLVFSLGGTAPPDSVTITMKPRRPEVPTMNWVAFDDARRPIGRGTAPTTISHAAGGAAITYCADREGEWLELTVDLKGGTMQAYGHCTRVTVRGKAVQTTGVPDPRLSAP